MCVAQQKSKCSREQEKEEKPLKETLCLTSPQIVSSVIPVVLTSLPPCLSSALATSSHDSPQDAGCWQSDTGGGIKKLLVGRLAGNIIREQETR